MNKKKKYFKLNKKVVVIGIVAIIIVTALNFLIMSKNMGVIEVKSKTVEETYFSGPNLEIADLDSEVYTQFLCTCCDNPLEACECGLAAGMRKWLKDQVETGITKEELLMKASKKYGMKAIESEESQQLINDIRVAKAGDNPPVIEMEEDFYNFGEIKQSPEKVSTSFEILNTGGSDLVIDSMDTSCMCTTATITYNGVEGPVFGMSMHGDNPTDWTVSIPPGESAMLNVYYDPMAHGVQKKPSLSITRTVTVSTNDPVNFQKQVKIQLEQVR